jgi:hypothetical protein
VVATFVELMNDPSSVDIAATERRDRSRSARERSPRTGLLSATSFNYSVGTVFRSLYPVYYNS